MKYQVIDNKSFAHISGPDAWNFLQNIMTADIKKEGASYSLMLNPQGRYLSDFFIINFEDGFLLEFPLINKDLIISKIKMYKLRSNINVVDVSDKYITIFSDQEMQDSIISYRDPRGEFGFRAIFHKNTNLENNSELYYEIKYSIPIVEGSDMIYEKSIPLEYGMERFNSISFSKGCYVGQEVISRAKHTGTIRKQICIEELSNDQSNINVDGRICSIWKNKAIILKSKIDNPI